MLELALQQSLADEPGAQVRLNGLRRVRHLHRHLAADPLVGAEVDLAHPALAEHRLDRVARPSAAAPRKAWAPGMAVASSADSGMARQVFSPRLQTSASSGTLPERIPRSRSDVEDRTDGLTARHANEPFVHGLEATASRRQPIEKPGVSTAIAAGSAVGSGLGASARVDARITSSIRADTIRGSRNTLRSGASSFA